MKRLLAGLFACVAISGAAQATTYQYDITMSRSHLSVDTLAGWGPGAPEIDVPGVTCELYNGNHFCEGEGDFTVDRFGASALGIYDSIISGTLTIDSDYNAYTDEGQRPGCVGSALLCRHATGGRVFNVMASSDGFSISAGDGISYMNEIDEDGLFYLDDSSYSFQVGNTSYTSNGWGIYALYDTTSFEVIAPVPVPAGLLLLPSALLFLGLRRRQAAKAAFRGLAGMIHPDTGLRAGRTTEWPRHEPSGLRGGRDQ